MSQVLFNILQWIDSNVQLISLLALIISIFALSVGIMRLLVALYPIVREKKDRHLLNEKFSRGPYDESIIERSTRYYIRPRCSNMDPSQEKELRRAPVV